MGLLTSTIWRPADPAATYARVPSSFTSFALPGSARAADAIRRGFARSETSMTCSPAVEHRPGDGEAHRRRRLDRVIGEHERLRRRVNGGQRSRNVEFGSVERVRAGDILETVADAIAVGIPQQRIRVSDIDLATVA